MQFANKGKRKNLTVWLNFTGVLKSDEKTLKAGELSVVEFYNMLIWELT